MKIVVILLLLAVIGGASFSGLFFLYKDKGKSNRAVISHTIRIVLSLLVFLILMSDRTSSAGARRPPVKSGSGYFARFLCKVT